MTHKFYKQSLLDLCEFLTAAIFMTKEKYGAVHVIPIEKEN